MKKIFVTILFIVLFSGCNNLDKNLITEITSTAEKNNETISSKNFDVEPDAITDSDIASNLGTTDAPLEAAVDKENNIILDVLKNTDEIVNSYVIGTQKNCRSAQEIVDCLTEQSIVCYYSVMYSSSAVKEFTDFDGNIKKIVEHKLFCSYSDFQNLLYSTYCDDAASMIEAISPYLANDDVFLYDLSKSIVATFDIFQKGFCNEIIDCSDDTITFLCYYSILSSDYSDTDISSVKCEAVKTESGEWRLNNCIWVR